MWKVPLLVTFRAQFGCEQAPRRNFKKYYKKVCNKLIQRDVISTSIFINWFLTCTCLTDMSSSISDWFYKITEWRNRTDVWNSYTVRFGHAKRILTWVIFCFNKNCFPVFIGIQNISISYCLINSKTRLDTSGYLQNELSLMIYSRHSYTR